MLEEGELTSSGSESKDEQGLARRVEALLREAKGVLEESLVLAERLPGVKGRRSNKSDGADRADESDR